MVPLLNMTTACGTVTVGSWPNDRISEDTALQVNFNEAFDDVPSVLVQLAALDAHSPTHKRIETWASDVTSRGFRLHVRTWADSITWMVKVSWVASSNRAQVQLGTCHAKDVQSQTAHPTNEAALVQFPEPFECIPDIFLAWSGLDASGNANLCLLAETKGVCSRGFILDCLSWRPGAIAWSTTMAWIASSSPTTLQTGTESFGSGDPGGDLPDDAMKSGADKCVDIMFSTAFNATPSVALALVGADALQNVPTRIDTWADNVTNKGFQLHLRTWADSVTLFAKVAWVATADTVGCTVERIASHSPPNDYIVKGPALGQGVMGVTHQAKHTVDGQIYAVKTSKHPFNHHEESLRKELANLAKLPHHNNLLRYYTSVIEANRLHIVTEYLDAFKFAELLPAPHGLFPSKHHPNAVLKWIAQLFDGLAHMHAVGLMHRDLHNENVMVLRDPQDAKRPSQGINAVRIIDFGVGKVFDAECGPRLMSHPAGFLQYASPERRSGHEFDDRDDVWAGGCHLLELSTGKAINRRTGCGPDGGDFATSPREIQRAIQECSNIRCRETARYVLTFERLCRPSASEAHSFTRLALRPPTPACAFVAIERPATRKRPGSASSRGGRRTRPCRAPSCRK